VSDKPKGEKVYRIKAIEYFQKAFQENEIPEDDMPEYPYLIGELYRRVGDRDASINWLDRVSEAIGKDGAKKWLIDLAEQQKTHPKDFFDETEGEIFIRDEEGWTQKSVEEVEAETGITFDGLMEEILSRKSRKPS
jgi:tetratricopeptide (TPR) repeat protein